MSWEPYNKSVSIGHSQPTESAQSGLNPLGTMGSVTQAPSAPQSGPVPLIHRSSMAHPQYQVPASTYAPSTSMPTDSYHIPSHNYHNQSHVAYGNHYQGPYQMPHQQQPLPQGHSALHPQQNNAYPNSRLPLGTQSEASIAGTITNQHHHYSNPSNYSAPSATSHSSPYPLKHQSGLNSPAPGVVPPHTPHGPPSTNIFSNTSSSENDLPPELLALGWKRFWSKRENRWYFWNIQTGESLWELPPIPGRSGAMYDPMTDPLGISTGNQGAGAMAGMKRRSSSGEQLAPVTKKFILSGPWDLEISSNCMVSQPTQPQMSLLPPHPEVEQQRAQLMAKLRQCYQQACQSREGIDAPKDSLNRWLMEMTINDSKEIDPLFPAIDSEDIDFSTTVMYKELMNDIPMKITKPRFTGDARKQLSKYAEACKKIIETRNASNESRKLVKWKVEETFSWLNSVSGASFEALQERLVHLKNTCQEHVHDAAKSSVEGICKKITLLSKQYAQTLREAHLKHIADPHSPKKDSAYSYAEGKCRCQPAMCGQYTFSETGKLPQIEFMQTDKDHVLLKFKNDAVRLTTLYLQKLEQLYRYNCVDDRKFEFFLARCYCLLKRYNAYCEDFISCQSTQASLPVTVFEAIQRNFGVTLECFSSPLNCYFRQYCSAFPDTDGYYGSRGHFLKFFPTSGSFQVNPPFSHDLISASISHIEEILAASKEPLSFIIFLQEPVEDRGDGADCVDLDWLKRVENSRWKRKQITIPAFDHEFRHGALHMLPKGEINVRNHNATIIFWLQNEAGFVEWKPTDQRVEAIIDAYRPGRERERDRQDLLSPERQNPHLADKMAAGTVSNVNIHNVAVTATVS